MELVHEYTYLKLNQIKKFEYVCLLEQRTGVFVKFTKSHSSDGSFSGFMLVRYVLPHTTTVQAHGAAPIIPTGIQAPKPLKMSDEPRATKRCKYCGQVHEMDMQSCPAFGKYCSTCGLKNHLSSICLTKRKAQNIKAIDKLATDESSDSGETLFTVSLSPQSSNQ